VLTLAEPRSEALVIAQLGIRRAEGEEVRARSGALPQLSATASYDRGEWSVIFKRSLTAPSGVPFNPGTFVPIAFSVWDGGSNERGNKRGLSLWSSLYVEPQAVVSAKGPAIKTGLLVLGLELLVIFWVRRKQSVEGASHVSAHLRPR